MSSECGRVTVACGGRKILGAGAVQFFKQSIAMTRTHTISLKGIAEHYRVERPNIQNVFKHCRKVAQEQVPMSDPAFVYQSLTLEQKVTLMKGGEV